MNCLDHSSDRYQRVEKLNEIILFVYAVFARRQISTGDLVNQRVCLRASSLLPHVFHPKLPYDLQNDKQNMRFGYRSESHVHFSVRKDGAIIS
jgi:hypothetical protein